MIRSARGARHPFIARESPPPRTDQGAFWWDQVLGPWRLRHIGRGIESAPPWELGPLKPTCELSWVRQRHTATVAAARAGDCGVADALEVAVPALAALIATADCVPVALARGPRAILVHAGWRGIAAELPRRAAQQLTTPPVDTGELVAWIGPAIGPCCYEVGDEVVERVVAVSGEACVARSETKLHLDLRMAVVAQLVAAGASRFEVLDHCTKCRPEWLWSYRREGAAAGRNLTLLWRDATD